jgi:hypothetical protein
MNNNPDYQLVSENPDYVQVKYNQQTGALLAVHKNHNFDPTIGKFGIPRGDYERIAADILFENGHSVVLESEDAPFRMKMAEGRLDGKLFDIKGVEGRGKRNIEYKIQDAGAKGAVTIVLYFHDNKLFSEQQLIRDYHTYLHNSKSKKIQTVYYIVDGVLHELQKTLPIIHQQRLMDGLEPPEA